MTPMLRATLTITLGLLAAAAQAANGDPTPGAAGASAPTRIEGHARVADALAALSARDGNGTIVTHDGEGWTIVNEPLASAQWTFTPPGHEAHPAVVRRTIRRGADRQAQVLTSSLCEGPEPACTRLLQKFEALDERIRQAVRGRSAPTPGEAPAAR